MMETVRQYHPVIFDMENLTFQEDPSIPAADFEAASSVFEHHKMDERNRAVALFPEPLDRARMQRIRNFFGRLGLSTAPAIEIPPYPTYEQAEALGRITDDIYATDPDGFDLLQAFSPSIVGTHRQLHNIALLYSYRDTSSSRIHGSDISIEVATAHELGHSAGGVDLLLEPKLLDVERSRCSVVRSGFAAFEKEKPHTRGEFLNEAFVHMLAHAYRAVHSPEHSAGDLPFDDLIIPAKYTYSNDDFVNKGKPEVSTLAALGLELLIAEDRSLFDAMVAAFPSRGVTHHVIGLMNELSPNLYQRLYNQQYRRDDFLNGLSIILSDLHGGNAAAIRDADDAVRDVVQSYLDAGPGRATAYLI